MEMYMLATFINLHFKNLKIMTNNFVVRNNQGGQAQGGERKEEDKKRGNEGGEEM